MKRGPTPRNKKTHVLLAYPHPGEVCHFFMHSVCGLYEDPPPGIKISRVAMESGPSLPKVRNTILSYFLEKTDADYLWTVDTDMHFGPEILPLLLAADKDVISALCYSMQDGERFLPFHIRDESGEGLRNLFADELVDIPSPIIEVYSAGAACMLIKRHVIETLGVDRGRHYPYGMDVREGQAMGEDVTFCANLHDKGFKVYLHRDARIGHFKKFLI